MFYTLPLPSEGCVTVEGAGTSWPTGAVTTRYQSHTHYLIVGKLFLVWRVRNIAVPLYLYYLVNQSGCCCYGRAVFQALMPCFWGLVYVRCSNKIFFILLDYKTFWSQCDNNTYITGLSSNDESRFSYHLGEGTNKQPSETKTWNTTSSKENKEVALFKVFNIKGEKEREREKEEKNKTNVFKGKL